MFSRRSQGVLIGVVLSLMSAGIAWSQIANGSFRGTVMDKSGAVIANATVKLSEATRGISRETVTDDTGTYQIPNLPPGVYDFSVTFQGFQTLANKGVTLQVGQHATLDFSL